jgi:hypothetical protein
MLSRILLVFSLFIVITASCLGQENIEETTEAKPAKATEKFDEFGDIPAREFAPKLKKFLDVIVRDRSIGYIVFYSGYNTDPFKNGRYYVDRRKRSIFRYLERWHGEPRITMIDGPTLAQGRTELWIAAPGGGSPKIEAAVELIRPRDTATKTEGMPALIYGKEIDLDEALLEPEENRDDPDEEPAIFPKRNEIDLSFRFLNTLKENSGRLIFYLDENVYDLQRARALMEKRLLAEAGPTISKRVKIIYGGYREQPEAEVWDVLPNGIEPEPVADEKIP